MELALAQRATRNFLPDPVPETDIETMLAVGTHAPSAENSQPWVFVVVTDVDVRGTLSDLARRVWLGGGRTFALNTLDPRILADVDTSVEAGFGNAPVLVVLAVDTTLVGDVFAAASVFPAAQNILLAANALGYGSALTTFTTLLGEELNNAVGLPPDIRAVGVIPIGRAARPLGRPRRQPFSAKAHRDRYGTPWG